MLGIDLSRSTGKLAQLLHIGTDNVQPVNVEEHIDEVLDYMDELAGDFVMLPLIWSFSLKQRFPDNLLLSYTENAESLIPVIDQFEDFDKMIKWVNHVNFHAVVLRPSADANYMEFARSCLLALNSLKWTQVWVDLHMAATEVDPYHIWCIIKQVCAEKLEKLHASLSVRHDENPHILARWKGEKVSCLILSSGNSWLTGDDGMPKLSQSVESFVGFMLHHGTHIVVPNHHDKGQHVYLVSIELIKQKYQNTFSDMEAEKYRDILQTPMQPLKDNLDSHAYTTFQKDPVKYRLYQAAFEKHLRKKIERNSEQIKVVVVGAGERGPLIECCLRVIHEMGCYQKVEMYAIEKNINALIGLNQHSRKSELWTDFAVKSGKPVQIVEQDARNWKPDFYIDLLLSELLGSFGDNELSPECLAPVMKYLNPRGGISIPSWSKSYVAPISSSFLHNKVGENKFHFDKKTWDIPYVVYFDRVQADICTPSEVWRFSHSSGIENKSDRVASVRFHFDSIPDQQYVYIHGLAGYFEASLYEDDTTAIMLSTLPSTHSGGHSWFPMFFPFEEPIHIRGKQTIEVVLFRISPVDGKKIWYEWSAAVYSDREAPVPQKISRIHNLNGNAFSIEL